MMNTSPRRKRSYVGTLAEPMVYEPPIIDDAFPREPPTGTPERWARSWAAAVAAGLREDDWRRLSRIENLFEKIHDLCEFFGISRERAGWEHDLALSLATRHEHRGFLMSKLFDRHSINPKDEEADFELALALATKYVPGFQLVLREPPPTRFTALEIAYFFIAMAAVHCHLVDSGEVASVQRTASILMNEKRLATIIPSDAAAAVTAIIADKGNKRRGSPSSLSISAIRGYIRELREAWPKFLAGKATPFQQQFVCDVWPIVKRLNNVRQIDGQKDTSI